MTRNREDSHEHSVDLLKGLDELNLEEADELLSGIEKVTLLYDEKSSLKARVLRKAGIQPVVQEIDQQSDGIVNHRRYIRKAIVCIAAVMIFSIVAIAATNMDALQRYWGNNTKIYSDRSLKTAQSVHNDNVKVAIKGMVADKYQCVFVLSLEALTKEGQKILKNANKDIWSVLTIKRTAIDSTDRLGGSVFQYTNANKNKEYKAYKCDFELENIDVTKPVTVKFDGMTMSFDIPESMDTITLYPEDEAEIKSVDLSPIGYCYKDSEFKDVRLINKDGTIDDKLGYHGSMSQENNEEVTIIGSFTELIDLDDYLGIQVDGIDYIVK